MEFRWIALLAVWTLISGPIIHVSSGPVSPARKSSSIIHKAKPVTRALR